MDLLTFFIGLVLGLLVGFVIAWFWANSLAKTKKSAKQNDETELKAIMAHQAESHLQTSKETIQSIEFDLTTLRDSIAEYEKTSLLAVKIILKPLFFGEHASMFYATPTANRNILKRLKTLTTSPEILRIVDRAFL